MSDAIDPTEISALDRGLLEELEPEAGRLLDRHLKVAQEWFPHEYIPYRLGRDFDKEPWTPDQPRLTGVAQTAFEIGLLTEDNLPSYHRLIHGMFGKGDGAWINWVGPLDRRGGSARDRAARLPHGHPQHRPGRARARPDDPAPAGLRPRRAGHAPRPRLRRVPGARDADLAPQHRPLLGRSGRRQDHGPDRRRREPAHGLLPRHPRAPRSRSSRRRRSGRSSTRSSRSRCPAPGSRASCARPPRSRRPASTTCGSTATRSCCRSSSHWGIFELTGLDAAAEEARRRLAEHLEKLDAAARRFEDRMARTTTTPRNAATG